MTMSPGAPAVRLVRLAKEYPLDWRGRTVRALDSVTLDVAPGAVCALIGANGSGKSTLLKLCAGLVRATNGVCLVAGCAPAAAALAGRVAYLPEETLLPDFDNARKFLARLAAIGGLTAGEAADAVERTLTDVGPQEIATQPLAALSKGQRQRVGLAQTLLRRPDVLLLDEPASGLDLRGQLLLRELLALQRAAGRTVLFSAHFLPQLDEFCDQVVVLDRGRVLFDGDRGAIAVRGGLERILLEGVAG